MYCEKGVVATLLQSVPQPMHGSAASPIRAVDELRTRDALHGAGARFNGCSTNATPLSPMSRIAVTDERFGDANYTHTPRAVMVRAFE